MICHVVSIVSGSKALSMIVEYKKIADASLHEEGSAIRLSKVACTTQSEHAAKNTVFEFSKLCSSKHGQWTEKQTKTNIISMFMRKSVLVIVATFNRFYYKSSRWILYFAQAIVLFASYFMLIETSEHSTMKSFYWMTTHVISYSTIPKFFNFWVRKITFAVSHLVYLPIGLLYLPICIQPVTSLVRVAVNGATHALFCS
ncbi:hypothetical protein GQR58_024081 [Nymphon striatum]|nr:hypothetical protein GQR58_024081 [Nymphon striatum]